MVMVRPTDVRTTAQITANQNDWGPDDLSMSGVQRISSDAQRTITGLKAMGNGFKFSFHNVGSFAIVLANESTSSFAVNRFSLGADYAIAPNEAVQLEYDGHSERWRTQGVTGTAGLNVISPAQITANQNDYNPSGLSTAGMIRLSTDADSRALGGLVAQTGGRVVYLHNVGSFLLTLLDEQGTSSAANRFALTQPLVIPPDGVVVLQYDDTTDRWRAGAFYGRAIVSPSQITSNQNDYTPAGLSTAGLLRLASDAARDLTGIAAPAQPAALDTCFLRVANVGSFNITLKDESSSSTAANRFALLADLVLRPEEAVTLLYDASRWRVLGQQAPEIGKGVDVTHSTTQSITNVTLTALTWDTETKDEGGYHEGATNPSRITIPTGLSGWYVVTAGCAWVGETFAGTAVNLWLRLNGAGVISGTRQTALPVAASFTSGLYQTTSKVIYLSAGDYIEAVVFHDDADAINVNGAEGSFSAVRLAA